MHELLDFDKDLIHLEAASKVLQLAKMLRFWMNKNLLFVKYVGEHLNFSIPTDSIEVACRRNASNKQRP
jgi:hypothetical protein